MSRSSESPARRGGALALVVAAGLAGSAARAGQTSTVVVERASERVPQGGTALVKGRLENATPGEEIAIEKRGRGGHWNALQTKPVDEEGRVTFRLRQRRTTATYRLRHAGYVGDAGSSDDFAIAVRPRLTIAVRPRRPFVGERVVVRGALRPARAGRAVRVQRRARGAWRTIERVQVRHGRYRAAFRARRGARRVVRTVFAGDARNSARTRKRGVKVYDPDLATWYGPGFYGRRTACGETLTRDTLGVAHRSLPCGTRVDFLYHGRAVKVRVIDRGPYTSAEWDLTERTARRLRFSGRDEVGTAH